MEAEVGLNSPVTIINENTVVAGVVDGIKLGRFGLERISIENIEGWFFISDGWQFLVDAEEEQDGSIQPE